MANTIRTKSDLAALLPDNTSGSISAQDHRDVMVSNNGADYTKTINAATYTLLDDDIILHVTYTQTGAVTITIPSALITDHRLITISDGGLNATEYNITIATEGAELINGLAADFKLAADGCSVTFYCKDGAIFIKGRDEAHPVTLSWSVASVVSTGETGIFGTYYDINQTAVAISSGNPGAIAEMYNRHLVLNVTTLTTSGTINLSGYRVNEASGAIAEHTEDITVSATGYYQSSAKWVSQVNVATTDASITTNLISTSYLDYGNVDFSITGARMGFKPTATDWDIALDIYKVDNDGSIANVATGIFHAASDDTYKRASNGIVGNIKYKWLNGNIPQMSGSQNEGLIFTISGSTGGPKDVASVDLTAAIVVG